MSEFPEWVERELGWSEPSYREAKQLHQEIREGLYPDPRGTGLHTFEAFWRCLPWFDRRARR